HVSCLTSCPFQLPYLPSFPTRRSSDLRERRRRDLFHRRGRPRLLGGDLRGTHRVGGERRNHDPSTQQRSRGVEPLLPRLLAPRLDRKSTRLNSSHRTSSYAVSCLKKKK